MAKKLVAYFSASGVTAKVADMLADAVGADIHEIRPKTPYIKADLNWMNKKSRSSIEMNDKTIRPEIAESNVQIDDYDVIFLGFPIWWYVMRISSLHTALLNRSEGILPHRTSGLAYSIYRDDSQLWWHLCTKEILPHL